MKSTLGLILKQAALWFIVAPIGLVFVLMCFISTESEGLNLLVTSLFFLIPIGGFSYSVYKGISGGKKAAIDAEKYEEEFRSLVVQLIGKGQDEPLAESLFGDSLEQMYRPKKGERVFWLGRCQMGKYKTKVEKLGYMGPTYRLRLAKGLHWRMGSFKGVSSKKEYLDIQGTGVLVITNKGVTFVSDGHGSNFSKTWGSISRLDLYPDAVCFQTNSGVPPLFFPTGTTRVENWEFPEMYSDPGLILELAKIASK